MTQQERTENKRILAEFLGATETFQGEYEMYGIIPSIEDGVDEQHYFWPSEMPFDTDWNWIMAVVDEINTTLPDDSWVTIEYNRCLTDVNEGGFTIETIANNTIKAVYSACVEFVKWHNKQN